MYFSRASVRKLICSECGKFLSVGPIKVTETGSAVCGRCNGGAAQLHPTFNEVIKDVQFPCSNGLYGCTERVDWTNARQHENECEFAKHEDLTLDDKTPKIIRNACCTECRNVINVSSIHQKEPDVLLCDRCPSLHVPGEEAKPLRLRFVEEVLQSATLYPCKFSNKGCRKLMRFDEVTEHETNCSKRPFRCPAGSETTDECQWIDCMDLVGEHLQREHPDAYVKEAQIQFDPKTDLETRIVFDWNQELFLILLIVDLCSNLVTVCVRHLGDPRLAVNYRFKCVMSGIVNDERKTFSLDRKNVGDCYSLAVSKACAVDVPLDGLVLVLRNVPRIMCSVDVTANEQYSKCRKELCDRVVPKDSIAEHEKECKLQKRKCKWPDCRETLAFDAIETHEECCPERSCCYSGCTEVVPRSRIQDHQNTCLHKWTLNSYFCYINNCRLTFQMPDLIGHIKKEHSADRIITGNTVQRTVAKDSGYDAIYLICYYSLFRFHTRFDSESMLYRCLYLGKREDLGKYRAVLEFSNGAVKLSKIITDLFCEFNLGNETSKFVKNGTITVRVTIIKA